MNKFLGLIILSIFFINSQSTYLSAQTTINQDIIDYSNPKEYTIGGITVSGSQYLDNNILVMLSGLSVGQKILIPGDKISDAIQKLYKQGLFEDIKISATKIQGDIIFLDIFILEQPKLSKFSFKGVKKTEADELREQMGIVRGDIINNNNLNKIKSKVNSYYIDKGYLFVDCNIKQIADTTAINAMTLVIEVKKGKKVKINNIILSGAVSIKERKLLSQMKETKEKKFWRVWKTSKYIEKDAKEDIKQIITYYNNLGYRDARIVVDSIQKINNRLINYHISIHEGRKFYFGDIKWVGNTKYSNEILSTVLNIKKGEVYNQTKLETRLFMDMETGDVHSLYMNDGYLFSSVTPVETRVNGDTIDLEVRIYEGRQAIVKHVTVTGNTKTHDHVIFREIRTKPGELFNRADIIRTQRELAQLQYFAQDKLGVNPKPNPVDGTVDIEYVVEETSSDQIEMSLGWGYSTLVGTVGVSFNNFSARNLFDSKAWSPIPSGDGQKLSLRVQSNGIYYQGYNISFTEPWLGGRKPNSMTFSAYHSVMANAQVGAANRRSIAITGASIGFGKRLAWPDDYFNAFLTLSFQNYNLNNYYDIFKDFNNGNSRNFSLILNINRNSIDAPIYPTRGSDIGFSIQSTPPYSLLNNKDYSTLTAEEKYLWLEFYKWKFNFSWYTSVGRGTIGSKLVLHTRAKFGFLGQYNPYLADQPFERFYLGGSGLSGYSYDGRELVGMRGYDDNTLTAKANNTMVGGAAFTKYSLELRYPISTNPMATIFVMGFAEAGNTYRLTEEFNPFKLYRSAGVGARIYLPMFGLLGLDWGYGFDKIPGDDGDQSGSQFHFSINGSID